MPVCRFQRTPQLGLKEAFSGDLELRGSLSKLLRNKDTVRCCFTMPPSDVKRKMCLWPYLWAHSLETAKNCGMKSAKIADPITTQKTRIESLKSALMHKQRTINLLNERNLGFQLKIKKLQDFSRSLAQQQSLGLAKDVGNQLITLNQALLASRLSFFKLSSNPLTLNVASLTPKRHNFQQV